MKLEKRILKLIVILVMVDLVTKLLALNMLPFEQDVFLIDDKISLYLTFNEGVTGGHRIFIRAGSEQKSNINTECSCYIPIDRTRVLYKEEEDQKTFQVAPCYRVLYIKCHNLRIAQTEFNH